MSPCTVPCKPRKLGRTSSNLDPRPWCERHGSISTPELLREELWGTLKQSVFPLVFMKNNQKGLSVSNWCIHVSTKSEQAPKGSNSIAFAIRTLRRMFFFREFPRALGRSKAVVTRMKEILHWKAVCDEKSRIDPRLSHHGRGSKLLFVLITLCVLPGR